MTGRPGAPGGPRRGRDPRGGQDRAPGPESDEDTARSVQALAAGGLPVEAEHRLARMRAGGAWTSDLSVGEFAALRDVQLDPVGQVMGSTVFSIGWAGGGGCGAYGWPTSSGPPRVVGTGQPSRSSWVGYPQLVDALTAARRRAVRRLTAECEALGGDGVVGLRLRFRPFPGVPGGQEVTAIGTAVRARGAVRPRRPFLADLSGQDVARLLRSGWVPCGLVVGVAICVRHDDLATVNAQRSWRNTELTGLTDLVHKARAAARDQARDDAVRQGGTGLVLQDATLEVSDQQCSSGGSDHVAQATLIGTALVALDRQRQERVPVRQVLHLDQAHGPVAGRRLSDPGRGARTSGEHG